MVVDSRQGPSHGPHQIVRSVGLVVYMFKYCLVHCRALRTRIKIAHGTSRSVGASVGDGEIDDLDFVIVQLAEVELMEDEVAPGELIAGKRASQRVIASSQSVPCTCQHHPSASSIWSLHATWPLGSCPDVSA